MNIGLYQNAANIETLQQWQDVISRNIASSSVAGFKQGTVGIEGASVGKIPDDGSDFSKLIDASVPFVRNERSMADGPLVRTGRDTDVALQGEGFFQLELPDEQVLFTRDGQFQFDQEYNLVSRDGKIVKGIEGGITGNPNGGELSINNEGKVFQDNALIGQLAIVNVTNPQALLSANGGFVFGENAAGEVIKGEVTDVENPQVVQGFYEGSNVSAIEQMVHMISNTRALEASQKVITTIDEHYDAAIKALPNAGNA